MKKLLLYLVCVFLPIITGVAITNYVLDPGEAYSNQFTDRIIEAHSKQLNVTNAPINLDDRSYKRKLCELYRGKTFDYLVLGHSRAQSVSSDMFKGASLLNLWVGGGQLEESVAFYEICKENNIRYKHVILCADPAALFNENYADTRWRSLGDYYYRFLNKKKEFHFDFTRIENLFSFSYFQTALKQDTPEDMKFVKSIENKGRTYRADGSMGFAESTRKRSQVEVDNAARTEMPVMFNDFTTLSEERLQVFDALVQAIRKDGADVYLLCSPYHPLFYKRIENVEGLRDGMKYIEEYAKKNHIEMIGHFNSNQDVAFSNKDFIDHAHQRRDYIVRLLRNHLGDDVN